MSLSPLFEIQHKPETFCVTIVSFHSTENCMKKSYLTFLFTVLAISQLFAGPSSKYAFNSDLDQYRDSIVRIITQNEDGSDKGLVYEMIDIGGGLPAIANLGWGTGTGFVINDQGYIVTNNHVIAPDALDRFPSKFILVVETVTTPNGIQRIAHKAKVIWQAPEFDVAIIQCTGLKSRGIPLDLTPTKEGDKVHTLGFPGMADMVSTDSGKENQIYHVILKPIASSIYTEFTKKNGREPNTDEQQQIVADAKDEASDIAQHSDFDNCLAAIGAVVNPTYTVQDTWNITDVINRNNWHNYFHATQSDGTIRNIADAPSLAPDTTANFQMIQHSLTIQHGNSGGPLLSDQGGVLGVVGRGFNDKKSENDIENVDYAASVNELVKWLNGDSSRNYSELVSIKSTLVIAAVIALIVAAFGFLVLGFVGKKHAATPAYAGVVQNTPPNYGSGGQSMVRTMPARGASPAPEAARGSGGWKLSGRNLHVEFNESLFSRNGNRLIVGRSADLCHIVLQTNDVSRQHAHIRKEGNSFFIADRNSSNRTAVNGQFTSGPFAEVSLREGDTLTFGEVKVEFTRA